MHPVSMYTNGIDCQAGMHACARRYLSIHLHTVLVILRGFRVSQLGSGTDGGMDVKLRYTGEEFVDVKAW